MVQKLNMAAVLMVQALLKSTKTLTQKVYLEKALTLVEEKMGVYCCPGGTGVINYHTRADNNLTNGVRQILKTMDPASDAVTLKRLRKLLQKSIENVCCPGACAGVTITAAAPACSGTGVYGFTYTHTPGTVVASAGTLGATSVTNVPVGTNVTLTLTSQYGICTATTTVTSPTTCP